jgi:hypothetical protein
MVEAIFDKEIIDDKALNKKVQTDATAAEE